MLEIPSPLRGGSEATLTTYSAQPDGGKCMGKAEQTLISAILTTADLATPLEHGIDEHHFTEFNVEFGFIRDYHSQHGSVPKKMVFRAKFPSFDLLDLPDVTFALDEFTNEYDRRALAEMVRETVRLLKSDDVQKAKLSAATTSARLVNQFDPVKANDGLRDKDAFLGEVRKRQERIAMRGMSGISLGFPTINDRTGGAQPGELWVVGARLGNGKTWTLAKMASQALIDGHNVEFFSLEQSSLAISFRIHTLLANHFGFRLSNRGLNSGRGLDLGSYEELLDKIDANIMGNLTITDSSRGRVSPATMAARVEKTKPDVVFVDYLTLLVDNRGARATEDWRIAATISGDVKVVAQEYDVPIVCAAQINRQGDGTTPAKVAQLAQADAIGQDADAVVTQAKSSKRVLNLMLAKYRHGEDGFGFYADFEPDLGVITEITADKADQLRLDDAMED